MRLLNRRKETTIQRGEDNLFSDGKIFKATDEELNNIIKDLSTADVANSIKRDRAVIRALVVLAVRSDRYTKAVQRYNIISTVILIIIALFTLKLNIEQTRYVELSTRGDRLFQAQNIRDALTRCENDSSLIESGIFNVENGEPANCKEVLRKYK